MHQMVGLIILPNPAGIEHTQGIAELLHQPLEAFITQLS